MMNWRIRITLAVLLMAPSLQGCGSGSFATPPSPPPHAATTLSVNPRSITVDAGSATTFTGVFKPAAPSGGSLTWSITPADGGTITGEGILTASATAGSYAVQASWTPAISSSAVILKGSATVTVLPVPQIDSVISPYRVQASGTNQTGGAIQNGVVAGQGLPAILAVDSSGNIAATTAFTFPLTCAGSTAICQ
jgi:hypothetical protein